jgi:hypothetical protein
MQKLGMQIYTKNSLILAVVALGLSLEAIIESLKEVEEEAVV